MTEQQQQLEDSSCAVDLSASALPDDKPEDKKDEVQDEVFTTTIEAIPEESKVEAATSVEATPEEAKPEPQSGFDCFGFSEALLKTLAEKGYSDPSPIQKAAFPELMLGRDLVGQAQNRYRQDGGFCIASSRTAGERSEDASGVGACTHQRVGDAGG